ncbi:MAG: GNAT family N-acetyltransferase [Candidatus Scalindua sp.]|nr:GNAT family N-acetyltransferase [Candidatus Scalindua sp.]
MVFNVERAGSENVGQISTIHLQAFQGEFLSSLGKGFLDAYYKNYLYGSDQLLLVAKVQDKTIGFVSGTLNSEKFYQCLFKNNFFLITKLTLKSFLVNKNFRSHILKKQYFMKKAIKSRFLEKKTDKNNQKKKDVTNGKRCSLISIAVLDEFRGKGVAVDLVGRFEEEMKKLGASTCALYVKKENLRGVGFYKKTGWQTSPTQTNDSVKFTKDFC